MGARHSGSPPDYRCLPARHGASGIWLTVLDAATMRHADPTGKYGPCVLLSFPGPPRICTGAKMTIEEARRMFRDGLAMLDACAA